LKQEKLFNFIELLSRRSSGQTGVDLPGLKSYQIPLPPLPEQRAIAEALSDVDGLISSLDKLIEKKRAIKQGAMQELLTGRKRLPGFNGKGEKKKLGELFDFSGGYSASRDQLSDTGFCYLHYGDIHLARKSYLNIDKENAIVPRLEVPLSRINSVSLLRDGDVVFVDASEDDEGASKHIVIENKSGMAYISGLHTVVAKPKNNELDIEFKKHCFKTRRLKDQFKFYAVGTKVTGISKSTIGRILLEFPPLSEQTAIATILSDMDADIEVLEKRRDKTKAIKQGMMQELLTGRIRLV